MIAAIFTVPSRWSAVDVAPLRLCGLAAVLLATALSTEPATAHTTGENYVWLNVETTHLGGQFQIRLHDLRQKLGLDIPSDYQAARTRVIETADVVQPYILDKFSLQANGQPVTIEFTDTDLFESDAYGHFAQYFFRTVGEEAPDRLTVRNELLFEDDRFHRSVLCVAYDKKRGKKYGGEFTAMVFSPTNSEQELDYNNVRGLMGGRQFVWQGMLHIWIGIDHILFLVALLIPAVLVRQDGKWQPVPNFYAAFWNVFKIVTLFTIAHSITLTLAALDIVNLSPRIVESTIALSIILVACNNLTPMFREGRWLVIFFFGLFHGLGFASVMGHLPFRMVNLVKVVLAFNIGVEIGQLAIVAAVFPIIFFLRNSKLYVPVILGGGSLAIAGLAAYWFYERAFGLAT